MDFDFMTGNLSWSESAELAQRLQMNGFSGMLFTETSQVPWMMISAAAMATTELQFSTGIAVAFPRSPMVSAQVAWELARNTHGRFRLGLGSQVRGHVVRRYGVPFDKPALRMKDYVEAFKACIRAFRGDERLQHDGEYYRLNYLPGTWSPAAHEYSDVKVDIAAVGPYMCRVAGEVADGIHVHPMHSTNYIKERLLPELATGADRSGRAVSDIELIVPVFVVPGDSPEERARLLARARSQIAFYGSTPNYAFQFDDLGFKGTTGKLSDLLRSGDVAGMAGIITDEMLDHFTVSGRWDDIADLLSTRYRDHASRLVTYLAGDSIRSEPLNLPKWGEIAAAVRGR